MSYHLIIDNREKRLINSLQQHHPDLSFQIEALDLGDIQLRTQNNSILFIIERKTLKDLAASIKDGRYREQKARMRSYRKQNGTRLLYIFEGNMLPRNLKAGTLLSCCVNTPLRDNIAVHRTTNMDGTIAFILKMIANLNKWPGGWDNFILSDQTNHQENYINALKCKKKDNLTPKVCFIRQLATVPGCSANIGIEIQKHYHTMPILIEAYSQLHNDTEKEALLKDIKINGRRIGPVKSARIYKYLFAIET